VCRRYVLAVKPALVERYVETGQLRLVFRAVLNHGEHSRRASEAAMCAGRQGRFWAMHDLLFERQRELWRASPGDLPALLGRWSPEVPGLDSRRFAACLVLDLEESLRVRLGLR
jgi:protein-disulfide isomerase